MFEIAKHIIERCGGVETVARLTGVSVTSVYRWTHSRESGGTGGLIPARHQQRLLEAAAREGIDLSPADFFTMPDARRAAG